MNVLNVPTPKLKKTADSGWYGYYAGFSPEFVSGALATLGLSQGAVVADPWNGSGTTVWAASKAGYQATGFDLNPVMVEVARGRMMPACGRAQARQASEVAASCICKADPAFADPLAIWFGPVSAGAMREAVKSITAARDLSIRAFVLTALMRTARVLTRPFRSANPTWIKQPTGRRVSQTADAVASRFLAEVQLQLSRPAEDWAAFDVHPSSVLQADAAVTPLAEDSVDAIVTSPPYCTRIDYARSTSVELAMLGVDGTTVEALRATLTGTTSIRPILPEPCEEVGPTCQRLLAAIRAHSSKSSANYYWKTFIQYFADLAAAVREAHRYLKPGGSAVFVVQDSWYKELHVDLAKILTEIAAGYGWSVRGRTDFPVRRTLRSVNTRSRNYRSDASCHETVMWFQTPKR